MNLYEYYRRMPNQSYNNSSSNLDSLDTIIYWIPKTDFILVQSASDPAPALSEYSSELQIYSDGASNPAFSDMSFQERSHYLRDLFCILVIRDEMPARATHQAFSHIDCYGLDLAHEAETKSHVEKPEHSNVIPFKL